MPPVQILLVEDDDIDAEAVRRAFRRANLPHPIRRAVNGADALAALRGTGGVEPLPRPHLVLLDLNLPASDGFHFLDELRTDPKLAGTAVFVLTTSDADEDVERAYARQAAAYLVKGRVGRDYSLLTGLLEAYLRAVRLPR